METPKSQGKFSEPAPRRPLQFGLSHLMQLVAVAALWCAVVVVRGNYLPAVGFAIVTTIATWTVVGRWAVNLPPRACRHVLAVTTAIMAVGGIALTASGSPAVLPDYEPAAFVVTGFIVFVSTEGSLHLGYSGWIVLVVIQCLVVSPVVYGVCLATFTVWDHVSSRSHRRLLAILYSALLAVMCMPLALHVLIGVDEWIRYGIPHSIALELWLLGMFHVAMLAAAAGVIGALAWHGLHGASAQPNRLKLLTWGYISFYGVMLFVALLCESIPDK